MAPIVRPISWGLLVLALVIMGAVGGSSSPSGGAPGSAATTIASAAATTNPPSATTNNTPLTTTGSALREFESDVTSNDPGSNFSTWATSDLDAEGKMACDLLSTGEIANKAASTLLSLDGSGQDPMTSDEAMELVQYAGQDICPDYGS